jgi:hypothetical protein
MVVSCLTILIAVVGNDDSSASCDETGPGVERIDTFSSLKQSKSRGTDAYFLGQAAGQVLEPLQVDPLTVRIDHASSFLRDGWAWRPVDDIVEAAVFALREACFREEPPPMALHTQQGKTSKQTTMKSCMESHFTKSPEISKALAYRLEKILESEAHVNASEVGATAKSEYLRATCENNPARWTLFARSGDSPQNMHYDTVASESENGCAAMTPAEDGPNKYMNVRSWMPITPVNKAPLLLANTTRLYKDACARRVPTEKGKSASWKIFDRKDFLSDCSRAPNGGKSGACRWFTSLGMVPGEILLFRNGMVMHGTARMGGEGMRLSLAIDCTTRMSPAETE